MARYVMNARQASERGTQSGMNRTLTKLRRIVGNPSFAEVSDEQLDRVTQGTMMRLSVEIDNLKEDLWADLPYWLRWIVTLGRESTEKGSRE